MFLNPRILSFMNVFVPDDYPDCFHLTSSKTYCLRERKRCETSWLVWAVFRTGLVFHD
jgi:hypothetical protein